MYLDVRCRTELPLPDETVTGPSVLLLYSALQGFLEAGLELAGILLLGTGLPEGRHFAVVVVVIGDGRCFGRFGVQVENASVVAGRSGPGPGVGTTARRTGRGRGPGNRDWFLVRIPVFLDVVGPYLVSCSSSLENGHRMQCGRDN